MQGNQIKEKLFHLLRTRTQTKQPNIQAHKKTKIQMSKLPLRLKSLHYKTVFLSNKSEAKIIFNKPIH